MMRGKKCPHFPTLCRCFPSVSRVCRQFVSSSNFFLCHIQQLCFWKLHKCAVAITAAKHNSDLLSRKLCVDDVRHSVPAAKKKHLATSEGTSADQKAVSSGMRPSYFPHLKKHEHREFSNPHLLIVEIALTGKRAPHRFVRRPVRSR